MRTFSQRARSQEACALSLSVGGLSKIAHLQCGREVSASARSFSERARSQCAYPLSVRARRVSNRAHFQWAGLHPAFPCQRWPPSLQQRCTRSICTRVQKARTLANAAATQGGVWNMCMIAPDVHYCQRPRIGSNVRRTGPQHAAKDARRPPDYIRAFRLRSAVCVRTRSYIHAQMPLVGCLSQST